MIPDSYRTSSPEAIDVHAQPDSNVAVNKVTIISERGVIFLVVALAAALAAYAAARVDSLKDHIAASNATAASEIRQIRDTTANEIEHYREDFLNLDRQSRMTELKLDDWTVVAHRAGLRLPGDYTRGPQGNLDAESFNIKSPEKSHGSGRNNSAARSNQNGGH